METDETTSEIEVEGGDPAPAGEATPPAIPDGAEADDDAAAPKTPGAASDAGEEPGEGGEGEGEDGRSKDPTTKMQKRIDKLTARNKGYEEKIEALERTVAEFKSEREAHELEDLKGLPVMPESLSADERAEVKRLRSKMEEAESARDFWERHAEDGATVNGREYSPEQCRRFARMSDRDAGRIEGRLEGIFDSGRRRLAAVLKKHGAELFGGEGGGKDSVEESHPRIPSAATPAAKKVLKGGAPKLAERAPSPLRAPLAAPGAAPKGGAAASLAAMTQRDFEAEFADF